MLLAKIPARLPTELIDLVTQYATTDTKARLAAASRHVYSISVRSLYASIPDMSVTRTTQCLLTLSKKPDLAGLVHSFSFGLPLSHFLQAFLILLSRALHNMNNLRALSLDMDAPLPINLLNQISSRLTKLTCILPSEGSYPISQFLSSQPTIEELHIVCRPEDISTLNPEAFPALKILTAPTWLLDTLLSLRLTHLSRLCILDIMDLPELLTMLIAFITLSSPPQSMELVIHVKVASDWIPTAALFHALVALSQGVRCIGSLRLYTYGDLTCQEELQDMFTSKLPGFPRLNTSRFAFQPVTSDEYISNSARFQSMQTSAGGDSPQNAVSHLSNVVANLLSTLATLSSPPAPQAEPDQTQAN
ncbi:hypothetical protein ACGC1H_001195 [Rhizoctonia solani]|uniref:Uncharacterized protein n=1 Tax=Rhizoctonia solani TaxID=456999 RepID=A0A8H3H368_9AGAM|nr:unnamed protein product [Rhizoctonia solani]